MNMMPLTRRDGVTGDVELTSAAERINWIYDQPQPVDEVRRLDAQSLYTLVQDAGMGDASELVLMASPEQIQALVDFDCWTRDDFDVVRFTNWLEVFLQAEPDNFLQLVGELDDENLVVWLREHCVIYIWETDQDLIDVIDDSISTSPDGVYAIVIPDEDRFGPIIRHLLHRLYVVDFDRARRLLEAVRWELKSDMVEHAFWKRTGRMGDLGFVPYHEAIEVYAHIDPIRWVAKARKRVEDPETPVITFSSGGLEPVAHQLQVLEQSRFSREPSFFARAMAGLRSVFPPDQLVGVAHALVSQFRAVSNRVHIADRAAEGDTRAARQAAEVAEGAISIGLELLAGDRIEVASRALGVIALKDLHRVGYAATAKLQHQAKQLVERGNLTITDQPLSLVSDDEADVLQGVMSTRPRRTRTTLHRFASLAHVEQAARVVSRVAFYELLFFSLLKYTKEEIVALVYDETRSSSAVEFVSFRQLFATIILNVVNGDQPTIEPLSAAMLANALRVAEQSGDALSHFTDIGLQLIADRSAGQPELHPLAARFAADVGGWLADDGRPLVMG